MYKKHRIAVIIPALNEEESLPGLLDEIPGYVDTVLLVDNGSTDGTSKVAEEHGARVLPEPRRGYGNACLKGMEHIGEEDVIVFLDADHSDFPGMMDLLIDPIVKNSCDMVISNRFTEGMEKGAMTFPQKFGNKLAVFLIKLFWGYSYKDLGPFRALNHRSLLKLGMEDKNYGWTIEMQIKALQHCIKICQVDVPYRKRLKGKSKVSSTISGVLKAGAKILGIIFYYRFKQMLNLRRIFI